VDAAARERFGAAVTMAAGSLAPTARMLGMSLASIFEYGYTPLLYYHDT
jgi:hypothetical protein